VHADGGVLIAVFACFCLVWIVGMREIILKRAEFLASEEVGVSEKQGVC